MNELVFVDILDVDEELKEKVRHWRNTKRVRQCMFTRHLISKEEHHEWLKGLRSKDSQKLWIIFADQVPIGSVCLHDIDRRKLEAQWGFYIGEDAYLGKGFAKCIVYKLLQVFFEKMKFGVLLTKVFSDNTAALSIYKGFRFAETRRLSSGTSREIVLLKFTRADWESCKRDFEGVFA